MYALHISHMHRIRDFTVWGKCKACICGTLLQSGPERGTFFTLLKHAPPLCEQDGVLEGEEVRAETNVSRIGHAL